MIIRQEEPKDYLQVANVIDAAFRDVPESDQSEVGLVTRLRKSSGYVPELSLVAEVDGGIEGHILFSKVRINGEGESHEALALAPVSVHPRSQGKGIGSNLIQEGHKIAAKLGYQSVVLLGHADYYPRFGYQKAADHQITFPFEAPDEACMVLDLSGEGLNKVSGEVTYPAVFFGNDE